MQKEKAYVVIPNWNGADRIRACLDSLADQTQAHQIVFVDNGSKDKSVEIVEKEYPDAMLIRHNKNKGFAGGVNAGIRYAIAKRGRYVALLNNDAVVDKYWLENLVTFLKENPKAGIAASKIIIGSGTHLDSTGENYSIWGLPFPRGRGETDVRKHDDDTWVFGASGGASIYRIRMLEQIGLFDQKFFAYYEDADISFRAQLAGWKIAYVPNAICYHEIGATSSMIKGFTTYHTIKNLPLIFWKDVPLALMPRVFPRLLLAHWMFIFRAISRGQIWPAFKGIFVAVIYFPNALWQRRKIQSNRKVPIGYINSIITHDLPPNAHNLRRLRSAWRKVRRLPA